MTFNGRTFTSLISFVSISTSKLLHLQAFLLPYLDYGFHISLVFWFTSQCLISFCISSQYLALGALALPGGVLGLILFLGTKANLL